MVPDLTESFNWLRARIRRAPVPSPDSASPPDSTPDSASVSDPAPVPAPAPMPDPVPPLDPSPLAHPSAPLPAWLADDPLVQKYQALLGGLPWERFPERTTARPWPGPAPCHAHRLWPPSS
jgi:hypothetical protein